jgi:parallel beta helix pectate lyase-like protein
MGSRWGFAALFISSLVAFSGASGRTWMISPDGSGDAPTIQAGIDSSSSGDSVLVHPGTYYESISFRGRNITVKSSDGPGQTTIDATGTGSRVVTFSSNEHRAAVISGFTLTGGDGGIAVVNAEPSIINNVITGNSETHDDGGGIICVAGFMQFQRPLISGNTVTNNFAPWNGGGIEFFQYVIPELIGNRIEGNHARDGDGGGIYYAIFGDGAVIRHNTVINNIAGDHGGGVYIGDGQTTSSMDVEISWNLVANNTANGRAQVQNSAGGIWLWATNAWVHHNTIVENTGNGPNEAYAGGLAIDGPGSPLIEQNIIAFNTRGGGIWCANGATPVIRNNLAWQNVGGDGVRDCADWWQSNGNTIGNPYFCDMAAGDFTVAPNSGVMTHPAGPLGAFPNPGCAPVAVRRSTWGLLKARY